MIHPIRKILVYVDGTEQSVTAAQYAVVLARSFDAELYALYVVNTRALSDLVKAHIFLESEQEEYHRDLDEDAERYLNHVRNLARSKGVSVTAERANGAVHMEILAKVKEHDIDLLVLGELSQIRSRRDELYNETERAMRSASCSVLIAKNEDRIVELFESLD